VGETTLGSEAPPETDLVRGGDHADGGSREEGYVGEVGQRGSKGDDLLDAVRPPLREDLRQQPTAAVPDQSHPTSLLLLDFRHAMTEAGKHALRVKCVQVDARKMRSVADALEPAVQQSQRPVAGEEPRNEQHRTTVAVRHTAPAKDRIPPKRVQLTKTERIPEPHWLGW
jgi:hypothetical protein